MNWLKALGVSGQRTHELKLLRRVVFQQSALVLPPASPEQVAPPQQARR